MTEKQVKELCKLIVEKKNQDLTEIEKELFKQAIDASNNWAELLITMKVLMSKE
ncbi:MAG: hypothetical protein IJY57_04740 [Clostridia bacterium]|nr:hypothetical protein [Clostridia bacterium]